MQKNASLTAIFPSEDDLILFHNARQMSMYDLMSGYLEFYVRKVIGYHSINRKIFPKAKMDILRELNGNFDYEMLGGVGEQTFVVTIALSQFGVRNNGNYSLFDLASNPAIETIFDSSEISESLLDAGLELNTPELFYRDFLAFVSATPHGAEKMMDHARRICTSSDISDIYTFILIYSFFDGLAIKSARMNAFLKSVDIRKWRFRLTSYLVLEDLFHSGTAFVCEGTILTIRSVETYAAFLDGLVTEGLISDDIRSLLLVDEPSTVTT